MLATDPSAECAEFINVREYSPESIPCAHNAISDHPHMHISLCIMRCLHLQPVGKYTKHHIQRTFRAHPPTPSATPTVLEQMNHASSPPVARFCGCGSSHAPDTSCMLGAVRALAQCRRCVLRSTMRTLDRSEWSRSAIFVKIVKPINIPP